MLGSHIWLDSIEFLNDKSDQSHYLLPLRINQFPELTLQEKIKLQSKS